MALRTLLNARWLSHDVFYDISLFRCEKCHVYKVKAY